VRRPVATAISDDGTLLAVASPEHRLNVYHLTENEARLTQTITLNGVPRVIEFSPEAAVLSVAYDGGIEVYALGESALPTDRRAVRCSGVDHLVFSQDGLMLLGSSCGPEHSDFVTISPPLYADTGLTLSVSELRSRMWTTQILFPEIKQRYSHAALVGSTKDSDQGAAWVVGYDLDSKAFRMTQLDEPANGHVYFVGPGAGTDRDEPGPGMVPAASEDGDLLALGFQDSEIRLYGLFDTPSQLLQVNPEGTNTDRPEVSAISQKRLDTRAASSNSNRLNKTIEGRKRLIQGHPLVTLKGTTAVQWVKDLERQSHSSLHRLVAVAPGGVNDEMCGIGGDCFPVDGGRIMLIDFECSPNDGQHTEVTIEVGEVEPTPLPEHGSTLDVEVELARRRTTLNRRVGLGSRPLPAPIRSVSSIVPPSPLPSSVVRRNSRSQPTSPLDYSMADAFTLLDSPYSNTSPRSHDILNRAATAAATNTPNPRRYQNARPSIATAASTTATRRIRQIPHESDADNWVPPPPPYTPEPGPLPIHLRNVLPSRQTGSPAATAGHGVPQSPLQRSRTTITRPRRQRSLSQEAPTIRYSYFDSAAPLDTIQDPSSANLSNTVELGGSHSETQPAASADPQPPSMSENLPSPPEPETEATLTASETASSPTSPSDEVRVIGRNGPVRRSTQEDFTSERAPVAMVGTSDPMQPPPAVRSSTAPIVSSLPATSVADEPPSHALFPRMAMTAPQPTTQTPQQSFLQPYHLFRPNPTIRRKPVPSAEPPPLDTNGRFRLPVPNKTVERSRSRSQDVPRRRQLVVSQLFDARTGRKLLSSQSDAGMSPGGRSATAPPGWEPVERWASETNGVEGRRKKKRDFSRCLIQ
jgi:hypothetical protein